MPWDALARRSLEHVADAMETTEQTGTSHNVPEPPVTQRFGGWGAVSCYARTSDSGGTSSRNMQTEEIEEKEDEGEGVSWEDYVSLAKAPRRGRPPKSSSALGTSSQSSSNLLETSGGRVSGQESGLSGHGGAQVGHPSVAGLSLMVPKVASFLPTYVNGHQGLSVCSQVLQNCIVLAKAAQDKFDHDVMTLHQSYVCSGSLFHHASTIVKAAQLGVPKNALHTKLMQLAAAHVASYKVDRVLLEQLVSRSLLPGQLVCYIDYITYDETPLKTTVIDPADSDLLSLQATTPEQGVPDVSVQYPLVASMTVSNSSASNKLLQCRQHFCMLVKLEKLGFVKLYGDTPCHLQCMEKNNNVVLQECLGRIGGSSTYADKFRTKTRMCTVDKAGYNLLAEKKIVTQRSRWSSLVQACEVHGVARTFKRCYDGLMAEHVTGCLQVALAMRSSMATFRRCLQMEIRSKLKIYYGVCAQDAQDYREQCLSTFLTAGSRLLWRRLMLSALPNGDWRNKSQVEVFLPPSMQGQASEQKIASTLEASLTSVLAGTKPHLYPRHRWTGCDLSVEELGRLECIHGLLTSTFLRFMQMHNKSHKVATSSHVVAGSNVGENEVPDMPVLPMHGSTSMAGPSRSTGAPHDAPGKDVPTDIHEKHRSEAERAQDRVKGSAWLEKKPLSHLVLMKVSMTPLVHLLTSQLQMSGLNWERHERAGLLDPQAASDDLPHRQYQLTVAAEGVLEKTFFHSLQGLFHDESHWKLVADDDITVGFRSLCFKVLSRAGCMIYTELTVPHRSFPTCLFQLLKNPALGEIYAAKSECVMCDWSRELLQKYPGFQGEELQAILEAHAQLCATNTSQIESRHASLRRSLLTRSAHTHTMALPLLSAEHVLQTFRANREAFAFKKVDDNNAITPKPRAKVLLGGWGRPRHSNDANTDCQTHFNQFVSILVSKIEFSLWS